MVCARGLSAQRRLQALEPHRSSGSAPVARYRTGNRTGARPLDRVPHDADSGESEQLMASKLFELAGKRVYVAGHNGMVGSAIVRRLKAVPCELITAGRDEVDL